MNFAQPLSAATLVNAAVSVVLPWSMWPMVPTLTCGLERSNFSLAIVVVPSSRVYLTAARTLYSMALRLASLARGLRLAPRSACHERGRRAESNGADDQD